MQSVNTERLRQIQPSKSIMELVAIQTSELLDLLETIPSYYEDNYGNESNTPYEFFKMVKKHRDNLNCFLKR